MKIARFKYRFFAFLFVVYFVSCSSPQKNENNSNEQEGILIYEFPVPMDPDYPNELNILGQPSDSLNLSKARKLSNEEAEAFNDFMNNESSFNYNAAICWEPHFGAYFLNEGKVENYIEISLDCNRIKSAKNISHLESKNIKEINIPKGMSSDFRNFIKNLMKRYSFKYDYIKNSRYD